jgi:transposase-like protein
MKCAHCNTPRAKHQWKVQACADKRKKRSKWLCTSCDIELNKHVLEFLNIPNAKDKLNEYRNKKAHA